MGVWLQLALFLAAFWCFLTAMLAGRKLGPERIGAPPTPRQSWTAWIPGEFTPRGRQLRQHIGRLMLGGTLLLASGLVLSRFLERAAQHAHAAAGRGSP